MTEPTDEMIETYRAFLSLNVESRARALVDARNAATAERERAAGKFRSRPRRGRDVKRIWKRDRRAAMKALPGAQTLSLKEWARVSLQAAQDWTQAQRDASGLTVVEKWLGAKP